jgi:Na+-translocating ferredoxin:NAD+ oxidoreductase RnfC subunit
MHAIAAALRDGDVDGALDAGLLDALPCPHCAAGCAATVLAVRDERRFALAARERFRAREARLARRREERDARRSASQRPSGPSVPASALPPAAAAALARAKARANRTPR